MVFYIANGALQVHGDFIGAVGRHAAMKQKAVIPQFHKYGGHILSLRAAEIIAAAGDENQIALGLTGIIHQIRDEEGAEIHIILRLCGKLALHILRENGHVFAPDQQNFLVVGNQLHQRLAGRLGVEDNLLILLGQSLWVHAVQIDALVAVSIPAGFFIHGGEISNHLVVI